MDEPGWCYFLVEPIFQVKLLANTVDIEGWWCWWISLICVFLATFFSAIHVSLRHISWVKLEEGFANRGQEDRIEVIRKRLARMQSSMATLRMMANLGLLVGVVSYFTLVQGVKPVNSLMLFLEAFLISALVLSVFSVAIPQAWGKYAGTSLLVYCYPMVRFWEVLSWPLTSVLYFVDPIIRRLAGVSGSNGNGSLDEKQEELLNVVEEGRKEGVVDEEEREMIASVLEFRDTTAGEIMTPRTEVAGIEADVKLKEAVDVIIREGHSRYPVYEGSIDKIIGLLYAKDLLQDLDDYQGEKGVRHRLREPYFVPESKSLRDLLHDFQNQKVHIAVVLDEYGGTAGVVTIEDTLEELVGEIVDEYEPPQDKPLKKIDEWTFEIDARCKVEELNEEIGLAIPEEDDYETIGGFAFSRLGCIPVASQSFKYDNLQFTVIDAEKRKINRLRMVITPRQEAAEDGRNGFEPSTE